MRGLTMFEYDVLHGKVDLSPESMAAIEYSLDVLAKRGLYSTHEEDDDDGVTVIYDVTPLGRIAKSIGSAIVQDA
jgi:DNA-binding PadR family transcriptional regulator